MTTSLQQLRTLLPADQLTLAEIEAQARFLIKRIDAEKFDWAAHARPEQREPDDYFAWLYMAGRGAGKTRTMAETMKAWASGRPAQYAVIAANYREVRNVCFEAPKAGLLAVLPPELVAPNAYNKSSGDTKITLTNGSIIRAFSAEQPDALRGYAFAGIWMDEFAAWPKRSAQDVWDNAMFTLREAENPHVIVSTTPKNVAHLRALLERCANEASYVITHGHTEDNRANLSPTMLRELEHAYAGTRIGRQELGGELLEDVEHALWNLEMVAAATWPQSRPLPPLVEVVTSVDPSGSENGDATGIITVARSAYLAEVREDGSVVPHAASVGAPAEQGPVLILADETTQGTPEHRYSTACLEAFRHGSGVILVEGAYGGDNVMAAIRSSWLDLQRRGTIPAETPLPRLINAPTNGSKADRAQPVVALYEQTALGGRRIYHAKPLPALEDEMTTWEPDAPWSPNRIDAMVHGVRYLTKTAGYQGAVGSSVGLRPTAGARRRPGGFRTR